VNILAIETSSQVASVAILDEEKVIGEITINHKKTHSQKLMPIISTLFEETGLNVKEMDYIAVSVGPGSFTGIRIGIATAKGLAHPHGIKLIPVPTLSGLSYNIHEANGYVCSMTVAKKTEVYAGIFKKNCNGFETISKENVYKIDDMIDVLNGLDGPVTIIGDGITANIDAFRDGCKNKLILPKMSHTIPKATSVGEYALNHLEKAVNYDEISAEYIRKSQAEMDLEKKNR
jgi:tRNA threonylcarbamoyladenosine biosynthesis protein TsaB